MPRRIEEDHADFRGIISGRLRHELKKYIKSGKFVTGRGKRGKVQITIPKIDIPHIVFGDNDQGIGRGPGNDGDIIEKGPKGNGNGAGNGEQEGITVNLELDSVLKFLENELQLPKLKPKSSNTFDEIKIKYNDISLIGPESLRHNKRTYLQALKRQAAEGTINNLDIMPGCSTPMRSINIIKEDKRYRQYKEIKIPSTNALIIYARDGSGSMDDYKCDIISDMAWWMDVWIRRFYKRVDRLFVWHDTNAIEVDEEKFYNYRHGGGTECSSALKFIASQFQNRYPPNKWNIYVFYFTDGDNWKDDNPLFIESLKRDFGPQIVNLVGVTQIMPYQYLNSVKQSVDGAIEQKKLSSENIRTTEINLPFDRSFNAPEKASDEVRNKAILNSIIELIGNPAAKKKDKNHG